MMKRKWILALLTCLSIPFTVIALDANSVSIEANQYVSVGEHIEVSVLVTHKKSLKVDKNSFIMNGKKLDVRFVKEIKVGEASDLVISIYKYTIPPKKQGSYTISPVSVSISGKTYTSYEGSYNVQ
jgi:uncharacterized protein (DUF58 family)